MATEEKSKEIATISEVLRLVGLNGAIITIEAMGTQAAIADQIVSRKGDYILALKANQNGLFQQVLNYGNEHISDDFAAS